MDKQLSEKVQIFIHGRDYQCGSKLSSVRSKLLIYESDGVSLDRKVYQSQTYQTTSPKYTQSLLIDYFFQKRQTLTFRVLINDEQHGKLQKIPLSHIVQDVRSKRRSLVKGNGDAVGELEIWCERVVERDVRARVKGKIRLVEMVAEFSCFPVDKGIFLRIIRQKDRNNQKSQLVVYQSSNINQKKTKQWPQFNIQLHKLCQNDPNQPFTIQLYYQSTLDIPIGSITLTLNTLKLSQIYSLKNNNKTRARISFIQFCIVKDVSFLDYLKSGLGIRTALAIDFTESNGRYDRETSNHYIGNGAESLFQKVMNSLLRTVLEYNSDKKTAVLGFGAAVNHPNFNTNNKVSHCFPITMNEHNPYLSQKPQILQSYRRCIPYLDFAGPTLFSPLIKWAMQQCKKIKQNSRNYEYLILVVLTDGQVCDKQEVMQLLKVCSGMPFSMVVVGVGEEDFGVMGELGDGEQEGLRERHRESRVSDTRKLFKFMEYAKYENNHRELIKALFGDIPKQVQQYFQLKDRMQKAQLQKNQKLSESILKQSTSRLR